MAPSNNPGIDFIRTQSSAALAWLTLLPLAAQAGDRVADAAEATALGPIVVTATRSARDAFDLPASIDTVDVQDRLRLGASPAELLGQVPGVVARDRHNYAQDTQISIRGFGARASFGIRGVRLLTDGIQATQPDGQGQVSHFNLDSADRIEVLRGPFSALYGNASGGVIQLFTADGAGPPEIRAGLVADSDGAQRASINLSGGQERVDYNLDATWFHSHGFRPHSRARRQLLNMKLGIELPRGRLTLVGNGLLQPQALDPLGLTRAQFDQDPYQTAAPARQFNTRKRADQGQAGAIYELPLGTTDSLRAMVYGGQRGIEQYLSIPAFAQLSPTSSGGVIDLDNGYGGGDLRWTRHVDLGGQPVEISVGIAFDALRQHRRGYENFVGTALGVRGRLRRDEIDTVESFDQYAQAEWRFTDTWSLLAGVRHSRVTMRSRDRYVTSGNPDDSGRVAYGDNMPVAGLMFRATPSLHLYASYGRGFETPTFSEVGYRADGGAGLAFDLEPATSDNVELGAKWRQDALSAQLALFRTDSENELAVATSSGGRTTYQNIGSSRRRGAELSADWSFVEAWRLGLSYSHLDARFTSAYLGCSARCSSPDTPIAAGTRIPGVPADTALLALRWQPRSDWSAALDLSHVGSVTVDDFGSESAPAYSLLGAELGRRWRFGHGDLQALLRVDNLADRAYAGSVIVNDGNGRYYEPGPGRSWLLGLRWTQRAR